MLGWSTSSRSAFAAVLHGMLTIFVGVAFLGCGGNPDAGARAGAVESGTGLPPAASGVMGASPVASNDAGGFAGVASPRPSELPAGNGAERLAPAEQAGDGVASGAALDAGVDAADPEGDCPFSGNVRYQLNGDESWPPDVRTRIGAAMEAAVGYYNCYADLSQELTINYNPGVPTAEANVDGWLSFGSNPAYMVVATAMHEVGHTLGVGFYPWSELIEEGRWRGPAVVALITTLPAAERDPDAFSQRDFITADAQHFWPYGLNQASEHQSEWSLINHVRVVAAMQRDKQAFLNGEL